MRSDSGRTAARHPRDSDYPALRGLEDRGFISSEWGISENNRRARFYTITATGRACLRKEARVWIRYAGAVTQVLRTHPSVV
jgi:DNA-binding PadR family transcriptional regulator